MFVKWTRRPPSRRPSFLLLALAAVISGCHTFAPVQTQAVPIDQKIRIRFATPRDLALVTADQQSLDPKGVRWLEGRVEGVRGDTLLLQVSSIDRGEPRVAGANTRIVLGDADQVAALRLSARRTVALSVLASGAATFAAAVWIWSRVVID